MLTTCRLTGCSVLPTPTVKSRTLAAGDFLGRRRFDAGVRVAVGDHNDSRKRSAARWRTASSTASPKRVSKPRGRTISFQSTVFVAALPDVVPLGLDGWLELDGLFSCPPVAVSLLLSAEPVIPATADSLRSACEG